MPSQPPPQSPDRQPAAPRTPGADPAGAHRPAPVEIDSESVAGEEDPGASLDTGQEPDGAGRANDPGVPR